ncbi:akirin-2-like [Haemaphysalis longicornis]
MACVPLKRPGNDRDTLASARSAKRPRRGAPPSSARSRRLGAFRAASKRHLDDPDGTHSKIRRYEQPPEEADHTEQPSHFPDVPLKTPEEIAADVRDELRRLQHRRQLVGLASDGCEGYYPPDATTPPGFGLPGSSAREEQPLFTFEQVGLICERAMRERDGEIRAEYDRVLREKLSEQYDAFVKFTYDQIRMRFEGGAAPSYLS